MPEPAPHAFAEKLHRAGTVTVAIVAAAVTVYCVASTELMLVVPPAIAALTAGASVVGSIGGRLESRVARASAALAVPVGFACVAFVMITLMLRGMHHGAMHIGVMRMSAVGVSANRYATPFWLSTTAIAALYARDSDIGPKRLAQAGFTIAVLVTAALITAASV